MAEMSTTYISTLPTGSAGGSKYLVQDDGNNTTKVTVNDAVASATAITSANSSISSINTKIGSVTLPTTAQTLTGAIAEHESDITALNGKFVVEAKTVSVTNINAGSTEWCSASVAKSGYSAIGILGWYFTGGTANTWLFPYSMRTGASSLSVAIRNLGTAASSGVSLIVDVLYQKT